MATVAETLDQARELIEAGWTQGDFVREVDGVRCFCALGAIEATCGDDYAGEALTALRDAIGEYYIALWNDDSERTQAEVIEAFRKAAELAREQGE